MTGKIIEMTFPDGVIRRVKEVNFNIEKEDFNFYRLDNGTSVKVKTIVGKIFQVVDRDGKNMYTMEGDPYIIVRSVNQVFATEP